MDARQRRRPGSVYRKSSLKGNYRELSPGGARVGHASLMRPDRPLPTRLSVCLPLRRNPNIAKAIIAALVPRWHRASVCSGAVACLTNCIPTMRSCVRGARLSTIQFSPFVSSSN